jgi:hypothetical protein
LHRNAKNVTKLKAKKTSISRCFQAKKYSILISLYFFIFLGFNIFYTSFPIHAVNGLKWSVTELGIFYAVLSGIMVLVQGPVLRKALKKFSEENSYHWKHNLGINFIFISNDDSLIYVAAILFAVGNGLMWPSFMSILSKISGNIYQGFIQGVASSFGSLASIFGLTIGGFLYNLIGGTTFLISAGIIFAVFSMSFRLLKIKE